MAEIPEISRRTALDFHPSSKETGVMLVKFLELRTKKFLLESGDYTCEVLAFDRTLVEVRGSSDA